jgi:hypothetical protein
MLLARVNPQRDYTELRLRLKTWWLIIGVFCLAVAFDNDVSLVVFAFVSFLAFKEYLSLIPTRRADHRVLFWAYLSIPIQYYWISIEWYGMFIIFIPVFVFLFLPMRMVLIGETQGFLARRRHRALGADDHGIQPEPYGVPARAARRGQSGGRRRRAALLPRISHPDQRCRAIRMGQVVRAP